MIINIEKLFEGFSPASLEFLSQLRDNNNKPWFNAHKQDYLEYVLNPLQRLVQDLSGLMLDLDPYFETRPAVDKTISRIYRDTRFSHDKSPYKNNAWITFKRPNKQWQDYPAYFFELTPEGYSFGMGYYSASKTTMDKFRERLSLKPAEFLELISRYSEQQLFKLEGELYKRPLPDCPDEALRTWFQRKSLYLICEKPLDPSLFNQELLTELVEGFRLLAPLYHYLSDLKK